MAFDPPTSSDSQAYDSAQDADRVELIGSAVVTGTVDQGTGGASAWLVAINGVPHVVIDSGSVAVSNLPATQPVSGTVAVSAVAGTVTVDGSGHTQPVSGTVTATGPLTDTQLRATAVPVSGTVAVSNLPATQPVSGTVAVSGVAGTVTVDGSGHTQPVSGAVSVSNLPATQPVSGTVAVSAVSGTVTVDGSGHTQPVSGSVSVSNFPATQPVSGTVALSAGAAVIGHVLVDSATIAALTDGTQRVGGTVAVTQSTSPWVVDGSATVQPVSGTFFQATQPVAVASLPLPSGAATDATVDLVRVAVRNAEFDAWLRFDETRWS